jgi:hypothetical protein
MVETESHVSIGGKMEDNVRAPHSFGQLPGVKEIALDEAETRIARRGLNEPS